MKKKIILMTLLLSTASLTACGNEENTSSETLAKSESDNTLSADEWAMDVSKEVSDQLFALASDDTYLEAISSPNEMTEIIKSWRGISLNTDEIYVIDISEKNADSIIENTLSMKTGDISEVGRKKIINSLGSSIPTFVTSIEGTSTVSAQTVMQFSESYAVDYDLENQIRIIATDKDNLSVCVSFIKAGDGVINVNAAYMPHNDKNLEETVNDYLHGMNIPVEKLD